MSPAPPSIIAVAAEWRVRAGQEATVRQHEPGSLLYLGHQDPADPTHFLFYEQYADQQAPEAHRDFAHYQGIVVQQIVPLLTERTITFYQLLG